MGNISSKISKRIFDIVFSFVGILLLSPLLIIIILIIKLTSKGPVFFLQQRVGIHGNPFYIFKFRTMVVDAEKLGRQITVGRDPRITKVGYFLRKFKFDELPQLFNVLIGDMSFVGPRPEVQKYVNMYTEEQREILKVKPGITDYASIEFRNENEILGEVENPEEYYISTIMPTKIALNKKYIENNNLFIDIKIILKTIAKCL